ncbi:hypothetical protein MMC26_007506 [Xylographa opegraphella]|nr:hypothetical protein [Xylographa opegraphella]
MDFGTTSSVVDRSNTLAAHQEQVPHDPFLPPTQSLEQFPKIGSDQSPYGEEMEQGIDRGSWSHPPSSNVHQTPHMDTMSTYESYAVHNFSDDRQIHGISPLTNETSESYNSTSLVNECLADFEYPRVDGYAVHDFDNAFLLEANFGPLPIPEEGLERLQEADPPEPEEPTSATSNAVSYTSRRSTGIATLSSHLMSPSLTETSSPGSGTDSMSPKIKTRLLGGGPMSRISSHSTATDSNMHGYTVHIQHTPALTGSSVEASPEPANRAELSQHASPVVRIETYSRGDSPARVAESMSRTRSKRSRNSRSSSHLAAPCDDDDSEENDEATFTDRSRGLRISGTSWTDEESYSTVTRTGLDPPARKRMADDTVLNFKEEEGKAELEAKNAEVSKWLATSEVGNERLNTVQPSSGVSKYSASTSRRRAKSTSDQDELVVNSHKIESARRAAQSARIPGPGAILLENSDEDEDDGEEDVGSTSYADSRPASIHENAEAGITSEALFHGSGNIVDDLKPYDAHPWADSIYLYSRQDTPGQPLTSNAAVVKFLKRAADIETASRAATWGTNVRRLSEADLERMIGREGLLSRLSISKSRGKDQGERRGSFLEQVEYAASKLLPRKSSSNVKRKISEPINNLSGVAGEHETARKEMTSGKKENVHGRKESLGSHAGSPSMSTNLRRMPSVGKKAKSPKINTSSAVAAVATQIATLGGTGAISPTAVSSPTGAWSSARNALKRTARGDFHRVSSNDTEQPGIADLWNRQGGPPLPSFSSPPQDNEIMATLGPAALVDDDADADEMVDEKGIAMDFTPRNDLIIPTYDGFKRNVSDINPRLAHYLVDRIGQEQLRRYKKLVEFKVKHAQARQLANCASGTHCFDRGGVPTYFPSKSSQKEPRLSHTGFSTVPQEELDEDEEVVADGAVTAAQFPPGVPMPPVKRLPAQFECPLCFTVKRFQKPSDWSKHVHEDLQPFTCTFPTCPDPKSFKRKADWVRHENERHRQLEWWRCTEEGCAHQCFRRDNFVQHLVREHKMPEPKAKNAKPNKPAVRGPAKAKSRLTKDMETDASSEDRVLTMIETCRHETPKSPTQEACRFCGNICSSWKKLTVHLARHMEQISMPVLELVKQKDVTPDTIVSPIEPRLSTHSGLSPLHQTQSYPDSNRGGSPQRNARGIDSAKHELPAPFAPIQSAVVFNAPRYEDQVTGTFPWGHPGNTRPHARSQASPAADIQGINGTYLSSQIPYQADDALQFVPPHGESGFVQQESRSHIDNVYRIIGAHSQHVNQTPYAMANPYHMTMEQQPLYGDPYINESGSPELGSRQVPTNAALPIQYNISDTLQYTQPPTGQSGYAVNHDQQFYAYPM